MPVLVEGVPFYSVSEIADALDISRQTLWRWRNDGHVPQGWKYGGRHIVFSEQEVEQIREYAHRLEPLDPSVREQLRLFPTSVQGGQR
jgi:excisionase family DNA binding protein